MLRTHRALFWVAAVMLVSGCPTKLKHPNCKSDKDCHQGEKCVNQRCVMCESDSDCSDGKKCIEGACKYGCNTDDDCDDGKVCKDHLCVPCKADADCGEAGQCQEGKCLRAGECTTDDDCAEDEDCIDGHCRVPQSSADGDIPSCDLATVHFGFDEFNLGDDARKALQSNVDCLKSTKRAFNIVGHTDPRGTDEYNVALSDKRATMVADYLARLGIDPERMHNIPKGESEASGTDEAGWRQDRRVEFTW